MKHLLYLIGSVGSGKSTALAKALEGVEGVEESYESLPYCRYTKEALQLGTPGGMFPGTDRLQMAINPVAIRFIQETDANVVIAEGDRLANRTFFDAAIDAGFRLTIAWIDTPPKIAAERRANRGHTMTDSFIKSRDTKVRKLVRHYGRAVWRIDGRRNPEQIAERLKEHPAIIHAIGEAHR